MGGDMVRVPMLAVISGEAGTCVVIVLIRGRPGAGDDRRAHQAVDAVFLGFGQSAPDMRCRLGKREHAGNHGVAPDGPDFHRGLKPRGQKGADPCEDIKEIALFSRNGESRFVMLGECLVKQSGRAAEFAVRIDARVRRECRCGHTIRVTQDIMWEIRVFPDV